MTDDRGHTRNRGADSSGKEALDENVGRLERKIGNVGRELCV